MAYETGVYETQTRADQIKIAALTTSLPLQTHIAATSDDVATLIALARNLHLDPAVQIVLANNEQGLALLDRNDLLSSPHAQLLARPDIQFYPARIVVDENTPAVQAMILANADNDIIKHAAASSNVKAYNTLI